MTADIVARAFDPFFTTEGTGLGLSQVYGFAQKAGGTARIESRVGGGTTISLLKKPFRTSELQAVMSKALREEAQPSSGDAWPRLTAARSARNQGLFFADTSIARIGSGRVSRKDGLAGGGAIPRGRAAAWLRVDEHDGAG